LDAPLEKQLFDIVVTEGASLIESDGESDDREGE
jgi:hypothetical protein